MTSLKSIGTKVVAAMIATGLIAGAAFAAGGDTITVTLPEAVSVGGATLPGGQYTITEVSPVDGTNLFVFRSSKGNTAAAIAMRSAEPVAGQKTEVVLTHEGGTLHLDKLFIAGDSAGYQFAESK